MYDFMIMIGSDTARNQPGIQDAIEQVAGTRCRVIETDAVWAVRTNSSIREIRELISSHVGTFGVFVVVPMSGPWDGQNCTSAKKCFG
jgi:hypothetical protein